MQLCFRSRRGRGSGPPAPPGCQLVIARPVPAAESTVDAGKDIESALQTGSRGFEFIAAEACHQIARDSRGGQGEETGPCATGPDFAFAAAVKARPSTWSARASEGVPDSGAIKEVCAAGRAKSG